MSRCFAALALMAALTVAFSNQTAHAFNLGYSRGVNLGLDHIQVQRMAFRGHLALTDQRAAGRVAVNVLVHD